MTEGQKLNQAINNAQLHTLLKFLSQIRAACHSDTPCCTWDRELSRASFVRSSRKQKNRRKFS